MSLFRIIVNNFQEKIAKIKKNTFRGARNFPV